MKISKKLAGSIVIVAVGFSMLFPMEAVAKETKCFGEHRYEKAGSKYLVETTNHSYLCGTIQQEDGVEEYVYQDCEITITTDTVQKKCKNCGKLLAQQGSGEKWLHSKHKK